MPPAIRGAHSAARIIYRSYGRDHVRCVGRQAGLRCGAQRHTWLAGSDEFTVMTVSCTTLLIRTDEPVLPPNTYKFANIAPTICLATARYTSIFFSSRTPSPDLIDVQPLSNLTRVPRTSDTLMISPTSRTPTCCECLAHSVRIHALCSTW